jgi:hypothetical protein
MTTETMQADGIEISEDMKSYLNEIDEQTAAVLEIGEKNAIGGLEPGLPLAITLNRALTMIKKLQEQNFEAANNDFEERSARNDGQPFTLLGHKISKNSGRVSITFTGQTREQIDKLEKVIKEKADKIDILKKGAKAAGKDIRKKVGEVKQKFKMSQTAPKTKPKS